MAYPGINTTGFNAAPNQAANGIFGPQSAGISFEVFERNYQLIRGSSGLSTTVLGDLTKITTLGSQTAGATFGESAVLTTIGAFGPQVAGIVFGESAQAYTSRQVEFGLAPAGLTFGEDVTAFALSMIPKAMASIQFDQSGALQRTRQLMGASQITFSQSAASSLRGYLAGQSRIDFDHSGRLTKVRRIEGAAGIEFSESGNMTVFSRSYFQGQAAGSIQFSSFCEIARMRRVPMAGRASLGLSMAGDLTRLQGVSAGIKFSHTAILSAMVRKSIGQARAGLLFGAAGDVTLNKGRNFGPQLIQLVFSESVVLDAESQQNILLEFSEFAYLTKVQQLAASDSLAFDVEADLLNNPMTMDVITMIRPLNNREMLR